MVHNSQEVEITQCLSGDEQMWSIHTVNDLVTCCNIENLEDIILSERRKSQMILYCMISFL